MKVTFLVLGLLGWPACLVSANDAAPAFPGIICQVQPVYLTRPDGKPGREISINPGVDKLSGPAEVIVNCDGVIEKTNLPVDPPASSGLVVLLPAGKGVDGPCKAQITLRARGYEQSSTVEVPAEPLRTIYVLMHSHVDIGYTAVQTEIARKQAHNVARALDLIKETRGFPEGSRFKWNLEVHWPARQFLLTATPQQKAEFADAVRKGEIGIDAMHTNLLTGVCRAEELVRAFEPATALARSNGAKIESMMISDVPGLTWGVIPALNQAGVKYISDGANAAVGLVGDRIGYVRVLWENRPFWWVGPNGRDRVLYWGAQGGYSFGHHYASFDQGLRVLLGRLKEWNYTHEIVQMRWTKGDNGEADASVMPAVRDWNARHAYPKVIIATTAEAFNAFERRCGKDLPEFQGDFTPYWEDGAGSGARESGINRLSADRLARAETLWAMFRTGGYPAADFLAAWDKVLLWSEHTWGAHCSVSKPDSDFTKAQWVIKQGFARDAEEQSRQLLDQALATRGAAGTTGAVDVINTASWPRTDLAVVAKDLSGAGDRVIDDSGKPVPSQRLSSGDLAFLATSIPALGGRRFTITAGPALAPPVPAKVNATSGKIGNTLVDALVDPKSGAVTSLRTEASPGEWVNQAGGSGLNSYVYLPGGNIKDAVGNAPVTLKVKEPGPLVASLVAASPAPGCHNLDREVRVVAGIDRLEFANIVDKQAVRAKEGVHFGFDFHVPDCETRINSPWAITRVEKDQIPGACRNWYSVERWADVSNATCGVTLATIEAPLLEVGGLTANLPGTQPDPNAYLKHIDPSATLYSWAMNNHWHTNYRADQDGPTMFRYMVRAHGAYDPVETMRFGVEATQQLVVAAAAGNAPGGSFVTLDNPAIIINSIKPGYDGNAMILRLYNPTDGDAAGTATWRAPVPKNLFLSNLAEERGSLIPGKITVPARSLITVRAEP